MLESITFLGAHFICKIEIEYKTSSDSPALYWLTSAQTADGTHPFLLSNNKLIYARAWFSCQDTPSVKFTYTAKILVPKHFTVLMSALLQAVDRVGPELEIKDIKSFLEREERNDLNNMIQGIEHPRMLKCLLPNLTCLLPHKATEYVPYETGCMLLDHLEKILGGFSVFELFLKSYFHEFAFKSINTQDWINYLYQYFPDEKEILGNITWNAWFHDIPSPPTVPEMTAWETNYFKLTEDWVKWNSKSHTKPDSLRDKKSDFNVERIIFLNYLHDFHENLTEQKLALILYRFENHNAEIR
ncbi:leukotriene A-4 hydrolase-like, partial [Temnothorax nylanderi]|uniref:leukotriene A-4 hydrolase-like n=1 Tax=Temnothorax nylanderi TaxID=102681 RepID=UPI003A843615